jgi:hypothetical protein
VEDTYDYGVRHSLRVIEIHSGLRASRRAQYSDLSRRRIHVNPAAFFMSIGRIVDLGVEPSLGYSILHHRVVLQISNRRGYSGSKKARAANVADHDRRATDCDYAAMRSRIA